MYLDILVIDTLTPDNILTSYIIKPQNQENNIYADYRQDVHPRHNNNVAGVGDIQIYNLRQCRIEIIPRQLNNPNYVNGTFDFQFEHMGIPIGNGGTYKFVLAPGFRLTDFRIVDPYDENPDIREKREFNYEVYWDNQCKVQHITMQLLSRRQTFSFILQGKAVLVGSPVEHQYIEAEEDEGGFNLSCFNTLDTLGEDSINFLASSIKKKMNWLEYLELRPNIFGIGIDLRRIITGCMNAFSQRLRD